jgi:hypothetical protein
MQAGAPDHERHLEALRTFCVSDGIDPALADEVWQEIAADLAEPERRVRSLYVRRIRVAGDVTFDRAFERGVTVAYTKKNLRGKTSLLHVIKWAITGRNSLTPGVVDLVKAVWVELAADERVITVHLRRSRTGARASCLGRIDECSIDAWDEESEPLARAVTQSGVEDMARGFFQELLGLTVLHGVQKGRAPFTLNESPIDMGGFFNLVYVNQTDGYQMLVDRLTPNRQRAFEAMIGLKGLPALWRLRSLEAHLEADVRRDEWLIQQKAEPTTGDDGAAGEERTKTLTERYRELAREVEELKRRRDDLMYEGRALVDRLCQVDQIAQAQEVIAGLSTKRDALFTVSEDLKVLARDVNRHRRKIKAFTGELEANVVLSDVAPLVCPRCERELSEEDMGLEASGRCSICHHDAPIASAERQAELQGRLLEESNGLAATRALAEEKQEQSDKLRQEIQSLERQHARLVAEAHINRVEDQFAAEQTRLVEAADALARKSYELTTVKEQLTPTERGEVVQSEQTRAKLAVVRQLRAMLEHANEEDTRAIQRRFEQRMLEVLNEIQAEELVADVYIGDDYLPVLTVGGTTRRFNKNLMSAGQQARVAIAFHIALLLHGLEDVGRMPSFLLLDSPRQQEMNLEDFKALCSRLAGIGSRYADRAQIVIASSDAAAVAAAPNNPAYRIIPTGDEYIFAREAPGAPPADTSTDA